MSPTIIYGVLFACLLDGGLGLMCYKCAPSMPGCNGPFNWRGMGWLGDHCPEENDICVKLIERKGADVQITRDCLSTITSMRTDHPTDLYEGCKTSSPDIRLAHYVNNSIKEYDVKRNHFDETTWCYCFLDHRCNGSGLVSPSFYLMLAVVSFLMWNVFLKNRS